MSEFNPIPQAHQLRIRKLTLRLTFTVILMFGFAFALVPLYDQLCVALGINGKVTQAGAGGTASKTTGGRDVDLEFVVTKTPGLNWDFYPEQARLPVQVGRQYRRNFYARNKTNRSITVQAIPNITPADAAAYLQKVECFCFTRQTLAAGESTTMPVVFTVDGDLPEKFSTLTLSYSLYDVSEK